MNTGRLFVCLVIAWALTATGLVWWETGVYLPQLQHAYFWQWAVTNLLINIPQIPLLHTIATNYPIPTGEGARFPAAALAAYLNRPEMYHLPFPTWWWRCAHSLLPIFIGLTVAAFVWKHRYMLNDFT